MWHHLISYLSSKSVSPLDMPPVIWQLNPTTSALVAAGEHCLKSFISCRGLSSAALVMMTTDSLHQTFTNLLETTDLDLQLVFHADPMKDTQDADANILLVATFNVPVKTAAGRDNVLSLLPAFNTRIALLVESLHAMALKPRLWGPEDVDAYLHQHFPMIGWQPIRDAGPQVNSLVHVGAEHMHFDDTFVRCGFLDKLPSGVWIGWWFPLLTSLPQGTVVSMYLQQCKLSDVLRKIRLNYPSVASSSNPYFPSMISAVTAPVAMPDECRDVLIGRTKAIDMSVFISATAESAAAVHDKTKSIGRLLQQCGTDWTVKGLQVESWLSLLPFGENIMGRIEKRRAPSTHRLLAAAAASCWPFIQTKLEPLPDSLDNV
jgi:hypothetical protein